MAKGIGSWLKLRHLLNHLGEDLREIERYRKAVIGPIVVPIHLRERQSFPAQVINRTKTGMPDKQKRFWDTFALFVVIPAIAGYVGQISLCPQQRFIRAKLERRTTPAWVAVRPLRCWYLHATPAA